MGEETTTENAVYVNEYDRRTELITKMYLEGWLTDREVSEYIDGIINSVEMYDENGAVFWTVSELYGMPRQHRVEWAFEPTYYISAFLVKAIWNDPGLMNREGFRVALKGGLLASTYREFKGLDSDDDRYIRKTCELFRSPGATQFCGEGFYRDLCPEFTNLYFGCEEYLYGLDAVAACKGSNRK